MSNPLTVRFNTPDYVFHGTIMKYCNGLIEKPINLKFAGKNKDFGSGLYTTIDFYQASRWAKSFYEDELLAAEEDGSNIAPCVVVYQLAPEKLVPQVIEVLDFRGESRAWSNFILRHRFDSSVGECMCERHPQIVCGSMADNNTGVVIHAFREDGRNVDNVHDQEWFANAIVWTKDGSKFLSGLELGDQIAFFDEDINSMLVPVGYYQFDTNITVSDARDYWEGWECHVKRRDVPSV
ncbi:uncharacterized protein DUF3990 [Paenibacillus cellulosilyticus]|uniref:Uncharacterized protein DUF3990 n=1 Tax=Paenibacillus cellulosilyticus TaxID=375489 RepID=A0A2V2YUZ3_9BACL|nr:DUF3990 domain-containing protein [Paenibacillus cellulosilyticus]PWW05052.1 uncharacterized protein DUF3990 [Paenibacillus cellulosilyticus]QKS48609.1 DUF3990 domain-containing protein [Paenibacillus cellulosilyticus]